MSNVARNHLSDNQLALAERLLEKLVPLKRIKYDIHKTY
jgi:hypothetical protein